MAATLVAKATATLTIEITGLGSFSLECTMKQITEQATQAALNKIGRLGDNNVRVIGKPEISAIVVGKAP